ncbi:hypothetical protein Bca101_001612 [Brassica carinata]
MRAALGLHALASPIKLRVAEASLARGAVKFWSVEALTDPWSRPHLSSSGFTFCGPGRFGGRGDEGEESMGSGVAR